MPEELFADVLVEVPGIMPERTFQYRVPKNLMALLGFGHRVIVPFGGRRVTGFIVGQGNTPQTEDVKDIIEPVSEKPLFNGEQLTLARWIGRYYFCDTVRALQIIIAPALHKTKSKRTTRYYINHGLDMEALRVELPRRAPKSMAVLEAVLKNPGMTRPGLAAAAGASESVVDKLVSKQMLRVEYQVLRRAPYPEQVQEDTPSLTLSGEQRSAVDEIVAGLTEAKHRVFMLHGVTGSGKTEVYIHCIEETLKKGRQAITLVPEISLTPQMVKLYRERFGDRVAVLHSRMSDGERYDEWTRILKGLAPVVLGARSAVLAPVPDPGLIIMDEEHEWSYKQEETPRYHARAVALYRAQKKNGILLLGSATPSLESYCRALPGGVYKLVNLENRIASRIMPAVQVVDMRAETRAGNGGIFSRVLLQKLQHTLSNKEQTIIFLNRRGLNTLVVCRECGYVVKCPRCDVSLTYHADGKLRCHYCNYMARAPRLCPECSSKQVGYFGTGTQRVERELKIVLPEARVLRMDADTTTRKGSHQKILETFSAGGADILVGTQMIAKGLDIPGVTLVGVINADITLHMPDFRAAERTFQLLAQVAGRTGRGNLPGEVFIQTYTPEHYAVQTAARHDFLQFFDHEFDLRRNMGYPPFSKMVRLLVYGKDEKMVQEAAEKMRTRLDDFTRNHDGGKILITGPAPAPLGRLKENYRWHVVAWSCDYRRLRLVLEDMWQQNGFTQPGKGLHLSVDFDPMSLM
ncbi:MAG: primosomal protein N' [Peptococcaceae bacterium BRH_c8a]|nr:MAG: primosomal protein N' [Peptococcaceae bacterium BRH_c8a]